MLNTLLQAYALGCLSTEDIRYLRKNCENNIDFSYKDLGKYQNLAALLPSALPTEIPDHRVKEKIARKLYRLKNEPDVKKEKVETETPAVPARDIAKEIITKNTDTDSEKKVRITDPGKKPAAGAVKQSKDFGDIKLTSTHVFPVKIFYLVLSTIIALILGIVLGFLLFYEKPDIYTEQINKLSTEVQDLNNELVVHSGLLNLLEKKDTRVFPLYGSDIHPDGFGKIFLNSASNRAYLYISGVPVPPEDARYQLWLINSDNISPIGLFYPKNGTGYFYFTLPDIKSNNIRFLLTEEPTGGSGRPGKKIFLTSSN